jgi:NCS2 family nucleobase:cation symporter-2
VITGLTIAIIALELGIVGLQHALDVGGEATTLFGRHIIVAAFTFAACVGFTIWGRGIWKLLCTLLGMAAGVSAAYVLELYDANILRLIGSTPWLGVPDPSTISFTTHITLMPAFMAAGLAAAIRCVGVVTTCQKANDAAWQRPDFRNIRKGVLADGLGCTLAGLLGAPGMNVGPSLVGVSISTGVTSRSIAWSCAAVLLVLAFVPKVADVLLQLPLSVAGALLVFTASIMLASGLQLMLVRPLDSRHTFVIGLGLLFPLTRLVSLDYFDQLPGWLKIITNSGLAVGLISAILLLLVFRLGARHRQTIDWIRMDAAAADLRLTLNKHAGEWKLTSHLIDRAVSNAKRAIDLMKEGGLVQEPTRISALEHDGSLDIELHYIGSPLFISDLSARTPDPNEETAAFFGLQKVATDVFPDRSTTTSRGSRITLRLGFDI